MKVLVVDTETTGLPTNWKSTDQKDWPHIVQLSYILFDVFHNKLLIMHDWIIKVSVDISSESEKIHGISYKKSQLEGIDIVDALTYFNICMESADIVVAHNMKFDKPMFGI